jgi:hypothetical protein
MTATECQLIGASAAQRIRKCPPQARQSHGGSKRRQHSETEMSDTDAGSDASKRQRLRYTISDASFSDASPVYQVNETR